MGSVIEMNDTLQLTREQGFPAELDYEKHLRKPFATDDFKDQIFEFKDKSGIRMYHTPPVRNFLVENKNGKWLYWGLVHIISIAHDDTNKRTSGTFKIIQIYSPEDMKKAHELIDGRPAFNFFRPL